MRLVFFNILDGAMDNDARRTSVVCWLRQQETDVAALAELNGWESPGVFPGHRDAAGFTHGHVMSCGRSPYNVGVMARRPVEVVEEIADGVHHGVLHVLIERLHVVCTHFSPTDPELRVREAQRCVEIVRRTDGPLVLMGDLNSHSPVDRTLVDGFATPDNREWALDFRPHEVLLEARLIDLGASEPARWTTATQLNPTEPRRRLDFIYANDAFVGEHPNMTARAVRNETTDWLSDHYPVMADE